MTEQPIDLVAASRISRRVDLREIRLTDMRASCQPGASGGLALHPTYDHACVPVESDDGFIEVACSYSFKVRSLELEWAKAEMTYRVVYKLLGDEPADEADIEQFARANGAYHSWPFVRETIYSLTAKMGFPPYTLPVLTFFPKPKPASRSADGSPTTEGAENKT